MVPEALIVAGPNGAGKTTFAREFIIKHPRKYISADDIAEELSPTHPPRSYIQAGRQFFRKLEEQIIEGESFITEVTLAGVGFLNLMSRMVERGYSITIVFVYLDSSNTCIERIRERVRKGGHDVPVPDILRRFHRSIDNFRARYCLVAHQWYLVYNSTMEFKGVAFGERDRTVAVLDEILFREFLALTSGR